MCDVVLVIPANQIGRLGNNSPGPVFERLGVAYLASTLRQNGFEVEIIHVPLLRYSAEKTVEAICTFRPKIVGFSMMFSQTELPGIVAVAPKVKDKLPGVHISVGGPAASVTDVNLLESFMFVDSVVRGEGEYVLLEMIQRIDSGRDWRETPGVSYRVSDMNSDRNSGDDSVLVVRNPGVKRITDLDSLPFPDRSFIDILRKKGEAGEKCERSDIAVMSSSRGCYGNCNFCCVRTFYRHDNDGDRVSAWQSRTAGNLVAEIEQLSEKRGVRHFVFIDDNFIGPGVTGKNRATDFAQKLIDRKLDVSFEIACRSNDVKKDVFVELKRAGLNGVFLGIESGVQRSLDFFNKKIKVEKNLQAMAILSEIGIPCLCGFIMFDPFTTPQEILENLSFLRTNKITSEFMVAFNRLQVHPNTPLEDELREMGVDLEPVIEPGSCYVHKYNYLPVDRQTESIVGIIEEYVKESRARGEELSRLSAVSPDYYEKVKILMSRNYEYATSLAEDACRYLLDNKIDFMEPRERVSWVNNYFRRIDVETFGSSTLGELFDEIVDAGTGLNNTNATKI